MTTRILPIDIASAIGDGFADLTFSLTSTTTDIRVGLPTDTNAFGPSGFEVFVFSTQGLRTLSAGAGKGIAFPSAQVRVRAPKGKTYEGLLLAERIAAFLNRLQMDGWLTLFVEGDGVSTLGPGITGADEFSLNVGAQMDRMPRPVYIGAANPEPSSGADIIALGSAGDELPFRFAAKSVTYSGSQRVYVAFAQDLDGDPVFTVDGVETSFDQRSAYTVTTPIGDFPFIVYRGPAGGGGGPVTELIAVSG